MSEEKIPVALLKFGIPSIIGFLITAAYNLVDAVFVGNLGTNAMGAASVAFPITFLMIGIGLLPGSGAASVISRFLGEKKVVKAGRAASTAVFGSIIISLPVIGFLLVYLRSVLVFLGATENILPFAEEYSRVFIVGSIFSVLNIVLNHIARAEGAARISMNILIFGALLNIVLDPILIYTLGYGIRGAAIATLIAQGVSTVLLVIFFMSEGSVLRISLRLFTLSPGMVNEMIRIGIPYSAAQLLACLSLGLINSAAAPYGDAAVAAVGIANRIFAIGVYTMIGFSKGFQPIAGYNYGAGRYDRLKESIVTAIKWATYGCMVIAAIQIALAYQIVAIFSNEKVVIDIAVRTLRVYSVVFPFFGYQIIYMTLFLALGKAKQGLILSLGRQGVFLIPAILVLPELFGLNGVIYAQPLADLLTVILTAFYVSRWKCPAAAVVRS